MRLPPGGELFAKLAALSLGPLLLLTLVVYLVLWSAGVELIERMALDRARAKLAEESSDVEELFDRVGAQLALLATLEEVRRGDLAAIERTLATAQAQFPDYVEQVDYNTPDGEVYSAHGAESFNVHDRPYFSAIAGDETVVTPVLESRDSGAPIVLLLEPLTDASGRTAAVTAAIEVAALFERVRRIEVGGSGFAVLIDSEGEVISELGRAESEAPSNVPERDLESLVRVHGPGTLQTELSGEPYTIVDAAVGETGWTLALAYSGHETLSGLYRLRRRALLILGLLLTPVLVATLAMRRVLAQPMQALDRQSRLARFEAALMRNLLGRGDPAEVLGAALGEASPALDAGVLEIWEDADGASLLRVASSRPDEPPSDELRRAMEALSEGGPDGDRPRELTRADGSSLSLFPAGQDGRRSLLALRHRRPLDDAERFALGKPRISSGAVACGAPPGREPRGKPRRLLLDGPLARRPA